MILYVFLDEAGNFSGSQDRYFVLLAFATTEPQTTRKCFLKARHARLPRKYRRYAEIKFSDRVIPERFKEYVLQQLAQTNVQIYALVLDKRNVPAALRRQPEGMVYRHLVGQLMELGPIAECHALHVFLDRRHLKGLRRETFDAELIAHLLPRLKRGARLEIQHVDSTTNVNIQVADFLAGAVYQKYARGDERYHALIAKKIEVEQELFGE